MNNRIKTVFLYQWIIVVVGDASSPYDHFHYYINSELINWIIQTNKIHFTRKDKLYYIILIIMIILLLSSNIIFSFRFNLVV